MIDLGRAFARCLATLAMTCLVPLVGLGLASSQAAAQGAPPKGCPDMIAFGGARIVLASTDTAPDVLLSFIGHATFLIESPDGVRIATDYNDGVRASVTPDIATMNRAHRTHYSLNPEPGITHLLRGWSDDGRPARHEVVHGDVLVRNVPTNIRSGFGTDEHGNSIFVFELGELCIAHLGHLHHTLDTERLNALGRIDIVLVPVDGGFTLDTAGMIEVLRSINARLMIPMHFFNFGTLERFLVAAADHFPIERSDSPRIVVSRDTLPATPTVLVLPGR